MDTLIQILIDYGDAGMFIAAFLAGSVMPFSSEAVMLGLMALGVNPWGLLTWATTGNVLGGLFNYSIGRMGKIEWAEKYLHIEKKKLKKTMAYISDRGSWMAFFAFLPVLGGVITVALGYMRANIYITTVSMFLGKFLRYLLIILGVNMVFF